MYSVGERGCDPGYRYYSSLKARREGMGPTALIGTSLIAVMFKDAVAVSFAVALWWYALSIKAWKLRTLTICPLSLLLSINEST